MLALSIIALILLAPALIIQITGILTGSDADGAQVVGLFSILGTIMAIIVISLYLGLS